MDEQGPVGGDDLDQPAPRFPLNPIIEGPNLEIELGRYALAELDGDRRLSESENARELHETRLIKVDPAGLS